MNKLQMTAAQYTTVLEAMKKGVKFAKCLGNREIDYKRTKELHDSVILDSKKQFTAEIIVVPARLALEAGMKILRCEDGSEISINDEDIDEILVILDGQHRYYTILRYMKECIDARLSIREDLEGDRLLDAAKNMNAYSRAWSKSEFEGFYRTTGVYNEDTIKYQDAVKNIMLVFGVKEGVACFMIDFQKDVTRKSSAIEGKNYSRSFNQANVDRAIGCLKAMRYIFGDNDSIAKTINGLLFIAETRSQTRDDLMPSFSKDIQTFIACLDEKQKETAIKLFRDKNWKGYTEYLVSEFLVFQKMEKKDKEEFYEAMKDNVEAHYQEMLKKLPSLTQSSATILDRINSEREIAVLKEEIENFAVSLKADKDNAEQNRKDYKSRNPKATTAKDDEFKKLSDKLTEIKRISSDFNSYKVQFKKAFIIFEHSKTASEAVSAASEVKKAYEPIDKLMQDYMK